MARKTAKLEVAAADPDGRRHGPAFGGDPRWRETHKMDAVEVADEETGSKRWIKAGATYEKCPKGKDRKRVKVDAAKKVKEEELADDEKDDGEEHEEEA
eukprot:gene31384-21921_t